MENCDKKSLNSETESSEEQNVTSVSLQTSIDNYEPQAPEPFGICTSEDYAVASTSSAAGRKIHRTSPCGTKKTNLNISQPIQFDEKMLYKCAFRMEDEDETENVQLTSKEGHLNILDNFAEMVTDEEVISDTEQIYINYLPQSEQSECPDAISNKLITYQRDEDGPTFFSSTILNHQGSTHDETEISVIWKKDCRKWLWKNTEHKDAC